MKHDHDIDLARYRVAPGEKVQLSRRPTLVPRGEIGGGVKSLLARQAKKLGKQQAKLYAADRNALLIIFQGMDASGKDSAIGHVLSEVNPLGCQVTSFKQPSSEELSHDFLWRTTRALPERGRIGVFNRSYYEEVLVVRVHPEYLAAQQLPDTRYGEAFWRQRYRSINEHEAHLVRSGTHVVKFYLHVSRAEQRRRFLRRMDDADRHWKFGAGDVAEREVWDQYRGAYDACLSATSTAHAPWYVLPADDKPVAHLVATTVLVELMKSLDLEWPQPDKTRLAAIAESRAVLEAEAAGDKGDRGASKAASKGR